MSKVAGLIVDTNNRILALKSGNNYSYPVFQVNLDKGEYISLIDELDNTYSIKGQVLAKFRHDGIKDTSYYLTQLHSYYLPKIKGNFEWIEIDSLNNYNFNGADRLINDRIIKKYIDSAINELDIINLKAGDILTSQEMMDIFKVGNMGSYRKSSTNTKTFLIIAKIGYKEHYNYIKDNILYFNGASTSNNTTSDGADKALNSLDRTEYIIHILTNKSSNEYIYRGINSEHLNTFHESVLINNKDVDVKMYKFTTDENNWSPVLFKDRQELIDIDENTATNPTEREAIIKSRIGQSQFREDLLDMYSSCQLCNMDLKPLLTASHIKPWSESTDIEKLDSNNGLILCPHHDALFDKGYISFDIMGKILVSSKLETHNKILLNIDENKTIDLTDKEAYMKYHREYIFKG